jgi:beta-glucosidase-like glycosyl hydrolase
MTQTLTEPAPVTATGPCYSSGFLLSLIVTLLAPIFLGVTGGDIGLARMAAAETINDFRARNHMDLIAVAQIITNGLAAVDSLCRSMGDDVSLSMTLRLRGNAISLNRAAEQNRRVLRQKRDAGPVSSHAESAPGPDPTVPAIEDDAPPEPGMPMPCLLMNDTAIRLLAAEAEARLLRPAEQATAPVTAEHAAAVATPAIGDRQIRRMQAKAMLKEAGDLSSGLRTLPLAERREVETRIADLGNMVRELLTGNPPPVHEGDGASALMNGAE